MPERQQSPWPVDDEPARAARKGSQRALVGFLIVNLAAVVFLYARLLVPILSDGRYAPAWSDEYGYVADARSFAENGTIHAARLKEERVARIGGAGTHGPAYIVLQGSIERLFGDSYLTSLLTNVILLALTTALVLAYPLALWQRLAIVLFLLLHFVVFLYSFTYMVEIFQLAFSVTASLFLLSLHRADRGRPGFAAAVASYVVLLVLLSTFRVSYSLWALGLIPLGRNRREMLVHLGVAVATIAGCALLMQTVSAPNPYWPFSRALDAAGRGNVVQGLTLLVGNVSRNLSRYFLTETKGLGFYVVFKYVTLLLTLALSVQAIRRHDRLAAAASLIAWAHFLMLFVLYDAYAWREHRHLAPVFYLLVIAMIAADYRKVAAVLYLVLVASLPEVHGYVVNRIIPERRLVAEQWEHRRDVREAFARLGGVVSVPNDRPITILLSRAFFRDRSIFPLALPVRSDRAQPIRYTVNLGKRPDLERWKRIRVDYVLVAEPVSAPGLELVHRDEGYLLYAVRPARRSLS